jgi:hypothetical protein
MFQPRVIGVLALMGLVSQYGPLFLVLGLALVWNVVLPAWNPFDAVYNRFFASPETRLTRAPAPRRFSQGMAACFMLLIGISLLVGWTVAAWVAEGLLVVALIGLNFGKLCLGSYIYHLLQGRARFANHTLPWVGGS